MERLSVLLRDPANAKLMEALGSDDVNPDDLRGSVRELAIAIWHLETAVDDTVAPLVITKLVRRDDATRHPGFGGIEDEITQEDAHLAHRRASARSLLSGSELAGRSDEAGNTDG